MQLASQCLRSQAWRPVDEAFAGRVAAGIAASPAGSRRPALLRWAVAASVLALGLVMARAADAVAGSAGGEHRRRAGACRRAHRAQPGLRRPGRAAPAGTRRGPGRGRRGRAAHEDAPLVAAVEPSDRASPLPLDADADSPTDFPLVDTARSAAGRVRSWFRLQRSRDRGLPRAPQPDDRRRRPRRFRALRRRGFRTAPAAPRAADAPRAARRATANDSQAPARGGAAGAATPRRSAATLAPAGSRRAPLGQRLWSRDAADWLERIGPALAQQDYQGTLVTVSDNSIDTLAVYHAFDKGRERMRLVALTGPKREVIQSEGMVMCIGTVLGAAGYDGDASGRWNPAQRFAEAGKLPQYRREPGPHRARGRARLPGRRPAAEGSLALRLRLWLDHDTGLPLRIALLGRSGRRSSRWPSPSCA
jgi:hypothetical protein